MYDINGNMQGLNVLQALSQGAALGQNAQDFRRKQQQQQIAESDSKAVADILRGDATAIARLQDPKLIKDAQDHLREVEQRKMMQSFYKPATQPQFQANVTQNPLAAIMGGQQQPANLVQKQQASFQESQPKNMLDLLQTGKIADGQPASYDTEGLSNYLMGQGDFKSLKDLADYKKSMRGDGNEYYGGLTEGVDPKTNLPVLLAMTKAGAVPSGYAPRPKDGKPVPVVRNGQPVTVQVPGTNEVKILMSDNTYMSGGSIPTPRAIEEPSPEFTSAAINNAAARYNIDGTLPPMGMGKGGATARSLILNRAAELASGVDGTDQRVNQLTTKASAGTLLQLKKTKTMIKAFEEMANKNADIALEMSDKVDRTGTPVINRWILAGNNKLAGDIDTATFNTAVNVFANEYAKIMSGSMGNTPVSDSARKEAHEILNTAQTPEQLRANIQLLQREMKNRLIGLDASESELIQNMKGGKKDNSSLASQKEDHAHYLEQRQQLIDAKDIEGANMLTKMYKNKWGIK